MRFRFRKGFPCEFQKVGNCLLFAFKINRYTLDVLVNEEWFKVRWNRSSGARLVEACVAVGEGVSRSLALWLSVAEPASIAGASSVATLVTISIFWSAVASTVRGAESIATSEWALLEGAVLRVVVSTTASAVASSVFLESVQLWVDILRRKTFN